jgi:hypothetical protein
MGAGKHASAELATRLRARQPTGVACVDAVQMCVRIYVTVDGLPGYLHCWTSRHHLADVFASLGASGWIRNPASNADASSRAFWAKVVPSVTSPTLWVFDKERAETVVAPFLSDL